MWLQQCSIHSEVIDTDLCLLDFTPLFQDIQYNRFNYMLPPSVSAVEKNKVFGKATKKQAALERNNPVLKDWKLRNSEKWETFFMNKTNEGPDLSVRCKPCLKYHVKGLCYSNRIHQSSHLVLEKYDTMKTGKHIKKLRGKWFLGQGLSSDLPPLRVPPYKANMQSKLVGELVNQVGELYMKTDNNVSEFKKMKSYSEGVILPSNHDTKVSASNLKREISGKYLPTITSKSTKVNPPPLLRKWNYLVEIIRDDSASNKKTKKVKLSKSITQKEVIIPDNVQPKQATILPPITKGSQFPKPLVAVKISRDDI